METDVCIASRAISPSILVIDDHASVPKLVSAYISKAQIGHIDVYYAYSMEIAHVQISRKYPDLVLLDNLMPPHFDFRHSVKKLKAVYDGPVVLFSGEVPQSFGDQEIDKSLIESMSKDEISGAGFIEMIKRFIQPKN